MYFDIEPEDLALIHSKCAALFEEMRGRSLFMTGGTGFFGKWLVAALLYAHDHHDLDLELTVMSRNPKGFLAQYPDARHPALTFHEGDIRFSLFPQKTFDLVIHMATDPGYLASDRHLEIVDGMLTGTRRVMQFAHECNARHVLFSSSGAVYGPMARANQKIHEDYDVGPDQLKERSIFGSAKRMCEQWGAHFHHQHDLNIKFARCFAFYGPHMPYDHYAIGNFMRDAQNGSAITLQGDGQAVRSYMYGADLAIWLFHILIKGAANRAYNVGSDQGLSMIELAQTIQKIKGMDQPLHILGKGEKYPDRTFYVPDTGRAQTELGLTSSIGLTDGIAKTLKWLSLDHQGKPSEHGHQKTDQNKKIVVDIDGVIASLTPGNDYKLATPLQKNIDQINRLYARGYEVVLFTARGYETGIDWRAVTENHLKLWGVNYHALYFGKPSATYYVDDKMIPIDLLETLT